MQLNLALTPPEQQARAVIPHASIRKDDRD